MKPRIYTDTSVLGGCEDAEFAVHSLRLMESFRSGGFVIVLSGLTIEELSSAPPSVRRLVATVPESNIELVQLDSEANELADAYVAAGVLSAKMKADAQHIAMATISRVDVLVSWNFRHIVSLRRIRGYNSVNLRNGYPMIEIRTPREVLPNE